MLREAGISLLLYNLGDDTGLPRRPSAVFAASDEMAFGALRALRRAGLRVPNDVSVLGFDDQDLADLLELSTVAARRRARRARRPASPGAIVRRKIPDISGDPVDKTSPSGQYRTAGKALSCSFSGIALFGRLRLCRSRSQIIADKH